MLLFCRYSDMFVTLDTNKLKPNFNFKYSFLLTILPTKKNATDKQS